MEKVYQHIDSSFNIEAILIAYKLKIMHDHGCSPPKWYNLLNLFNFFPL